MKVFVEKYKKIHIHNKAISIENTREKEGGGFPVLCAVSTRGTLRGFSAGTHADVCDAFSGL